MIARRAFLLMFGALLFLGVPAEALAQGKVAVETMVVRATNAHSRVDSRLASMLPHLKHLSYTGYEVLDVRTDSLTVGQESSFSVAGGHRMTILLDSKDDAQSRLRVRMFKADRRLLDTTVSIHRNRSFIVAGPTYGDGVLILPMTARY